MTNNKMRFQCERILDYFLFYCNKKVFYDKVVNAHFKEWLLKWDVHIPFWLLVFFLLIRSLKLAE